MALKITTQIGTDKGITSEAYVRIADYQVSKYGSANFRVELFQTQADSVVTNGTYPTPAMGVGQARNQQIGENLWVTLTKEVEATRTVQRSVEVVIPATVSEDGTIETPAGSTWEMQDVEETYTATVPDLSALEDGTIFAFAYSKLKEKLVTLFGAENVVDC
jgi:hypothetical protein